MEYLVDQPLVRRNELEATDHNLKGKIIGLYFSASWCPPCQTFTPILAHLYAELQERNAPFEVVFVTFDKTLESMRNYMKTMHGDWLAVPFADPRNRKLQDHFDVNVIPKLIILRDNGTMITPTGRKEVQVKGIAAFRVWQDAAHLASVKQPDKDTPNTQQGTHSIHIQI